MKRDSLRNHLRVQPDAFRVGYVAALQPHLDPNALSQSVMQTADPLILSNAANVVRMWALDRQDVPVDFCDLVTIKKVHRQPIAFVVVDAEQVTRSLSSHDIPFSGDTYNACERPTQDLFELAPLGQLEFPQEETVNEVPVAGQEEVHICERCSGAGHRICSTCGAAGHILCPTCGGTRQEICPRCEGAGTHIGVRGTYIQCQACRTRGYVRCTHCASGNVPCNDCHGTGHLSCTMCLGHGNLLRTWSLSTRVSSWMELQSYSPAEWHIPLDCLFDDCQEIFSTTWRGTNAPDLTDALPAHLVSIAENQVERIVQRSKRLNHAFERISGMRVKILAAYLYKVVIDYDGHAEEVFLGGLHSQAFTHRGIGKTSRLHGWVRLWAKRLSRPFEEPSVGRAYLQEVRANRVHISDTRMIVRQAADQINATTELSAEGYTLVVPRRAFDSRDSAPTKVEVTWNVDDSGQLVLCTMVVIGPAVRRDKFSRLLSETHKLSFGRIALHCRNNAAAPQLAVVDRRLYGTVGISDYARILFAMASEGYILHVREAL